MKTVKINEYTIGTNDPIFVVAEIGINHNGDIELAKKLIDLAVQTGCHAVKFQKRTPDICVPDDQKNNMKETPWGYITYLEYKKKIEFGETEYKILDSYCKDRKIIWFASPWDIPSVEFLEKFDIPCYKIASASITDVELLKRVKAIGKPIILSTGMSTLENIKSAIKIIGNDNLILTHCNSSYPSPNDELNLMVIKTLKDEFDCPVGYSGHETGMIPTIISMGLGACLIERHITLDRGMWGTDQAASLSVVGLGYVCNAALNFKMYLGDGVKGICKSEENIIKKLRKFKNE